MSKKHKKYEVVGEITQEMADLVQFEYTGKVYMAPGVRKHIRKHKGDLDSDILEDLSGSINEIIDAPEYIGRHPKKVGTSMELVRKIGDNLLVALQVDLDEDYIYVASLYPITQGKLENRVYSGRFKEYKNKCE